jgi:hypothetical protein
MEKGLQDFLERADCNNSFPIHHNIDYKRDSEYRKFVAMCSLTLFTILHCIFLSMFF